MRFFRRRKRPADDPREALYVHLANDGAIFVIWGATGEQAWISDAELDQELVKLRDSGGRLVYSRESADEDPPDHVMERFERIVDYQLPIQLLEQPHPEAIVPKDQRRTIRRT